MPLYEYECESCGNRFERILQKFSDPVATVCPKCGGHVRKLFSSPAIQFKGSGFYITDYAKSGKAPEGGGSEKPAGGESASAEKPGTSESSPKTDSATSSSKTDTAASSSKPEPASGGAGKSSERKKSDSGAKATDKT